MARSRNIKPGFFQNEDLGELSPLTRLAFIGLWGYADFRGCIEYRPKRLKAQILPYDECDFEEIVNNLDKSGFIRKYSVQEKQYIKVVNFTKHQNPHKNEEDKGSDIPDITKSDSQDTDSKVLTINRDKNGTTLDNDGTTRADSLNLIPDSLIKDKPKNNVSSVTSKSKSKADVKTKKSRKPKFTEKDEKEFQEFFSNYPRQVGEFKARKAWDKKRPPFEKVMEALEWQKEEKVFGDDHNFAPNPEKYIADERWTDRKPKPAEDYGLVM